MQSPRDILADLWTLAGGDAAALDDVTLTGEEPQLPSSFRIGASAQAGIAAAGLAAAQIWKLRSGQSQNVAVDMRHAVIECRSERYLRVDDKPPPPAWDAIAGVYLTRDTRFVRLHTNFTHHRDAVCKVLNCKPESGRSPRGHGFGAASPIFSIDKTGCSASARPCGEASHSWRERIIATTPPAA